MNRHDAMTALGGFVVLAASTVAAITIRALLTAPMMVADRLNGPGSQPFWFVVRALSEALAGVVRHL